VLQLHITVDFATAAPHNGFCTTQEMFHLVILFGNCSLIKDEKMLLFFHVLNNIAFLVKGKLCKSTAWKTGGKSGGGGYGGGYGGYEDAGKRGRGGNRGRGGYRFY
jgi:hypothetical protein